MLKIFNSVLLRSLLLLGYFFFCGLIVQGGHNKSVWHTILVEDISVSEELAINDFQRYIGQVTGQIPEIKSFKNYKGMLPAILIVRENKSDGFSGLDIIWW